MSRSGARPRELPQVLFVEDVADALGVCTAHARRLMRSGAIPAMKRGKRWLARREDFLAVLRPAEPAASVATPR